MNVEVVKEYYGKVLKGSKDLKTSACCDGGGVPGHLEAAIANVHEEVRSKYYGCGIVIPAALKGCRVLDLGSGSGRDVYLISQLVGEGGEVVDLLKKHLFQGHDLKRHAIRDELGDVLWYVALLCDAAGLDLGDVAEHNVAKLLARYPKGFTAAESRHAVRNSLAVSSADARSRSRRNSSTGPPGFTGAA